MKLNPKYDINDYVIYKNHICCINVVTLSMQEGISYSLFSINQDMVHISNVIEQELYRLSNDYQISIENLVLSKNQHFKAIEDIHCVLEDILRKNEKVEKK